LVKEIEITPLQPKPGDPINIIIKGACLERVPVEIDYEQTIPVINNELFLQMDKVNVPWPKNRLFIEAKNVATLNVAAKFLLWVYKKVDIVNGVGQYTLRDVPKGTYSVKLNGTAMQGVSNVTITITAFSELQLDEEGICIYTFHPNPNHKGNLAVICAEIEKRVEIKPPL
jgi:Fe-S oxidoreductase